ncbi:T5orf172 domain protein [Paraliobacillus sp. PM-2]|uniref:GIY-YIG nuclease family protein n=1 Tax=Paraliobacillus sp. PM-2 TaxID=1462524 RepID=UPI00061C394C|nr:GIY-YIG nuclease family protein [Paraliobacillus sp. PM-2]CQR46591.1 T5orf172 domain protein [Paraliobacillus sp. PM-2]
MEVLYLVSIAFIVFFVYQAYKGFVKSNTKNSSVKEWHHLDPISQRFESNEIDTSYVYFIKESGMGHIKIGKADDPDQRKKELSTGSSHIHEIVHLIKTKAPYKTENFFHCHFRNKRIKGEWFDLTENDLSWIQREDYPREIEDSIKGY